MKLFWMVSLNHIWLLFFRSLDLYKILFNESYVCFYPLLVFSPCLICEMIYFRKSLSIRRFLAIEQSIGDGYHWVFAQLETLFIELWYTSHGSAQRVTHCVGRSESGGDGIAPQQQMAESRSARDYVGGKSGKLAGCVVNWIIPEWETGRQFPVVYAGHGILSVHSFFPPISIFYRILSFKISPN